MNREQYIKVHMETLRGRQAVELERAVQFFGEEWDEEHSDE